jgi:hypothetical protein
VKLEQATLDNGTVIEADMLEAGSPVFIATEDGQVPLPIGEYVMEDGRKLIVIEEGVIGEIQAAGESEVEVEVEASEDDKYVTKEEFVNTMNEIKSLFSAVQPLIKEDKEVELSEQKPEAAAKAIKPNPEKEAVKKDHFNYQPKARQTTESLIASAYSKLKL